MTVWPKQAKRLELEFLTTSSPSPACWHSPSRASFTAVPPPTSIMTLSGGKTEMLREPAIGARNGDFARTQKLPPASGDPLHLSGGAGYST